MKARKTIKHKVYTIEEKNGLVEEFHRTPLSKVQFIKQHDIACRTVLERWVKQVNQFGSTVDRRGNSPLKPGKNRGRPSTKKYTDMSKEELIKEIELRDDIKKAMAYLKRQKTNTKP